MPLEHPHVLPLTSLLEFLEPLQAQGKNIVFTNGCFDIMHPGHVDLLQRARDMGDVLVVGLNDDASVRRQGKGLDRPVNPLESRAFVLAHLSSVDFVTAFSEDTPLELIRAIRPQVLVKGGDWKPEAIVGREIVESAGGTVASLPLLPCFSTTALIAKIRQTG